MPTSRPGTSILRGRLMNVAMSKVGMAGSLTAFVWSGLLLSCGAHEATRPATGVPGQFAACGKWYLLSRDKRGVITDDRMRHAIDAGARTFHFETRQLCRQYYVGHCESFHSLSSEQRKELLNVADAALRFLDGEDATSMLSAEMRSEDRKILHKFLSSVR
jgi:hypothetical protein